MAENKKITKAKATKSLTAIGLAAMAFSGVWAFGNVVNGFGYFGGTQVIMPLLVVFVLYFLPYSLIVGELGSVFKNHDGGVSTWIFKTIGPRIAFFTGWIYWVVHMPYLSQKPSNLVISLNWLFLQNGSISDMPILLLCIICLIVFLVAAFLAAQGMSMVKKLTRIAGTTMFIMMILYIILIFAAPAIRGTEVRPFELKPETIMPQDWTFIANISILIFSVGGCEKFAPYVKAMKNPGKGFPLGMIFLVIMVVATAILGTIAMNAMYDGQNLPEGFFTNCQYEAFQKLGDYYGIGNVFLILYAASNALGQFSTIIVSIDAPLRILLGNTDKNFIPEWWFKKNRKGSYINGIKVIAIIVSILIMLPAIGIGDVDQLVKWLIKLNSVCMPLRYLFVFLAYFALKKAINKFSNNDYVFIKNKTFAQVVAIWCFAVTLFTCLTGMWSEDPFEFGMNVLTPVILCGIGLILPRYAKYRRKHPLSEKKQKKLESPEEYYVNFDTKEIILYCTFSVLTLGFYNLYWMYRITKSTNILAEPKDKTRPWLVVILTCVTLNIYTIYWSYKQAKIIKLHYEKQNLPIARHATVGYPFMSVLNLISVFTMIVQLCLLQNHINNIIEYDLQ